jgi:hypothetical protein
VVLIRKSTGERQGGFRIRVAEPERQTLYFNGLLCPFPIQFPDDLKYLRLRLRANGYEVSDRDCQALYHQVSLDIYPFSVKPEKAWLKPWPVFDHVIANLSFYLTGDQPEGR